MDREESVAEAEAECTPAHCEQNMLVGENIVSNNVANLVGLGAQETTTLAVYSGWVFPFEDLLDERCVLAAPLTDSTAQRVFVDASVARVRPDSHR